jgi:hypothetical protein
MSTAPNPPIQLTELQEEALIGSLLGDGHLEAPTSTNGNSLLRIQRTANDANYLIYEWYIFNNFLPPAFKEGIKYINTTDKNTGKTYYKCYFKTSSNPTLTNYRNKWYRQNNKGKFVKVVPLDLKLTAKIIAHWLADDGNISCIHTPYRFVIRFATDGFTKTEVEFLISLLKDRYNEDFYIHKAANSFIISASDSASRVLIADIDDYFIMQRKRLWDDPETRYYVNQPERQIIPHNIFMQRKDKLEEIISSTNNCISLIDLSQQVEYWDKNKQRPNYPKINKLLQPYLDSGRIVRERKADRTIIIKIVNR